jgi:hypothetical protein
VKFLVKKAGNTTVGEILGGAIETMKQEAKSGA